VRVPRVPLNPSLVGRATEGLLPSSTPFVTASHYHGGNIYSKEVLADSRCREKQLSGRVFGEWRCKGYDDTSRNVSLSADGDT
jgi:hypothetical protein